MNYQIQILFFLGGIGVFNSLIVSIYLLVHKAYSGIRNRLFGIFLFILSVRVLKSLFYAFSTEEDIWFLQSGPAFFLLIGPSFFTYIVSVLRPNSFWVRYWKHHMLSWVIIVILLMHFIPFKEHVELTKTTILRLINYQWLIFVLLSAVFVKKYENSNDNAIRFKWLISLIVAILIIWAFYFFLSFDYFISGSIIFSVLFYTFFIFFITKRKITSRIFEKSTSKTTAYLSDKDKDLIDQLDAVMTTEKLFLNPHLKLSDVAEKLTISTHELSKLINKNIGKTFTDFINEYRIEESKRLIEKNTVYTIEAIGGESGFNSKSAFYKAFKKSTNTTPSKFKGND